MRQWHSRKLSLADTVPTWGDPWFYGIVMLAAVLRLPGCTSDLWLDEIGTLILTGRLQSVFGIVTEINESNNHHLNSLFFYLLGDDRATVTYRLHSLVAGTVAVVLSWLIACRWGRIEAIFAATLMAVSYPMIHYSSEARGYSLVVCFALAAFLAMQRYLAQARMSAAVAFWLCTIFGVLSHLMFVTVFIAANCWFVVQAIQSQQSLRVVACRYVLGFGVPIAFLALFYIVVIRTMQVGAGPPYVLGDVLMRSFSFAAGGPATGNGAIIIGLVVAILIVVAALYQRHLASGVCVFTLVVVFLPPALAVVHRVDFLSERYFLIGTAFGLVACGVLLAATVRRSGASGICVAIAMAGFAIGNGINMSSLFRYGHGTYREALHTMAAHTEDAEIRVASDHDFRNRLILEYYRRDLPGGMSLDYVKRNEISPEGTEWMIRHRIGEVGLIDQTLRDGHRNRYDFVAHFPYSGKLSGWHWFLYRKSDQ